MAEVIVLRNDQDFLAQGFLSQKEGGVCRGMQAFPDLKEFFTEMKGEGESSMPEEGKKEIQKTESKTESKPAHMTEERHPDHSLEKA